MRFFSLLLLLSSSAFAQLSDQPSSFNGPVVFRNQVNLQGPVAATGPLNASGGITASDVQATSVSSDTVTASTSVSAPSVSATNATVTNLNVQGQTNFSLVPTGTVQRQCATVESGLGLSIAGCKLVTTVSAPFLKRGRACEPVAPTSIAVNTWAACRINVEGSAELLLCAAVLGVAIPTGQWCAEVTGA